jgi:hypothetical protein
MDIRVKPGIIRHLKKAHKNVETLKWILVKQKASYFKCKQNSRKPDKLIRVFNGRLRQLSKTLNRLDQNDL